MCPSSRGDCGTGPQFESRGTERQPDLIGFRSVRKIKRRIAPLVAVERRLSVTTLDEYGDAAEKQFSQLLPGSHPRSA
jgi:hypothetical protein